MSTAAPVAGRALESARSALRATLGDRVRSAGPDRTEALAMDHTPLMDHAAVELVGGTLQVFDEPQPTHASFDGFLDGIQRSSTLAYVDGVPLLHGTAAAAIRVRDVQGRMRTWRQPDVAHAVYGSRSLLGEATWALLGDVLEARGQAMRDADTTQPVPSRHPSALLRQSLDALSRVRNDLERALGDSWCDAHADRPLYVDGSLRTSRAMLDAGGVVGVVKSHATLYVPDDLLPTVSALGAGQRTSVIAALDAGGTARFFTWYLRLRNAAGHDPFFGLIRAETGVRDAHAGVVEARASEISAWLLAERSPLARPDSRWDVMPYAIRDCEVYLRAVA